MHRPSTEPIGLQLIGTTHLLSGALDDALNAAGGSLAMWRILVSQKDRQPGSHPEGSEGVGDASVTDSDELTRMEIAGLVTRTRDPENPNLRGVEVTGAGNALFRRLLRAVVAFDTRLRTGLTDREIATLSSTLHQLRSNVADDQTSW
jgi:MarR family transcriptional regulator, transcriptional regulator for hemolysin